MKTMKRVKITAIWMFLGTAGCGGTFDPDLSDLGDGDEMGDGDGDGDGETTTGDGEGEGDGDGDGDGEDTSTTDETDTGETDTGALEPNDPCDPLLEVEGVEVCPEGHSCGPGAEGFQCLPLYTGSMVYGVEVGDLCGSPVNASAYAMCYRSACGLDFNATVQPDPPYHPVATEMWAEFCAPVNEWGDESYCCTDWCDPSNPVQCDAGWECIPAEDFEPYGFCAPIS